MRIAIARDASGFFCVPRSVLQAPMFYTTSACQLEEYAYVIVKYMSNYHLQDQRELLETRSFGTRVQNLIRDAYKL